LACKNAIGISGTKKQRRTVKKSGTSRQFFEGDAEVKGLVRSFITGSGLSFAIALAVVGVAFAQDANFHNAPKSATKLQNPFSGDVEAAAAGAKLYSEKCVKCHGEHAQGVGNVPALRRGPVQMAPDGELFWFITKGSLADGMPSWASLPERQRWELVTYVKSLAKSGKTGSLSTDSAADLGDNVNAPRPAAPFTDFRYEAPGTVRKIMPADLPAPYVTKSADNGAKVVKRPADAWPKTVAGFTVQLYATDLDNPRLITTAPNGDFFVAESDPGEIMVFRGITPDGRPDKVQVFASGLKRPYGIAFYPPGPDPQWVYVGEEGAVVRFPYKNGDLEAHGPLEHLVDLPTGGGHWTRSIQFAPDGKKMFVAVGSASNVDDPDKTPAEKNRAAIWELNPDGTGRRIYASGIRNAGGGLAIRPETGTLWCSVNERDALGDDLVPDYITHVEDGGFYGWPWYYIGGNQDPRHEGKHPELKDKVIVPDVLLQPHNASLELTFYEGKQFPEEYHGDIFASEHGSWNRSVRAGYEVIRVPLHQTGKASGEYEDFVTGFVLANGNVWGRPVGITVAQDGSLLVTDDGSNSIWRIAYGGK
jgi:glucose/arabinose dehydrogenase/mono/diheme cytochrome c family protein